MIKNVKLFDGEKTFENETKGDLPFKLKLLTALSMAPSTLVANVRELRNKLEHFYEKPSIKEVIYRFIT